MVINKEVKHIIFFILQVVFFVWLKFVTYCKIVFVSSIISLYVITESSIIFASYLPFLQLHVVGLQIKSFSHTWCSFGFLHPHWHLSLTLTFTIYCDAMV